MKLRVQALREARAEPCHWSEGRHNNVGVSLREMRVTMQVMLGVSLQARWDATVVDLIISPETNCTTTNVAITGTTCIKISEHFNQIEF